MKVMRRVVHNGHLHHAGRIYDFDVPLLTLYARPYPFVLLFNTVFVHAVKGVLLCYRDEACTSYLCEAHARPGGLLIKEAHA